MKNRSKKGFTLIELVIVVAILGILMAIAIPSYTGVVRTARSAQARAFASQMNVYVMGEGITNMMASGVERYPPATENASCIAMFDAAIGKGDASSSGAWNTGLMQSNLGGVTATRCVWTLIASGDFAVIYEIELAVDGDAGGYDYALGWSDDAEADADGVISTTTNHQIGLGKIGAVDLDS